MERSDQDTLSLLHIERFLRSSGLTVERVVTGNQKTPDFFCSNPHAMWVEVKPVGEDPSIEALGDAFYKLKSRAEAVPLEAEVFAHVNTDSSDQTYRRLFELVKRVEPENITQFRSVFCIVKNSAPSSRTFRCEIRRADGNSSLLLYQSNNETPPVPWTAENEFVRPQNVTINDLDASTTISINTYLETCETEGVLQLVEKMSREPGETSLTITTVSSLKGAHRSFAVRRLRSRFKEAHSQIKAGMLELTCSSMIAFDSSGFGNVSESSFLSAFLGDFTISFAKEVDEPSVNNSSPYFGRNRLFQPTKNKSISAVALVGQEGRNLVLLNPFASNPIPLDIGWAAKVLIPNISTGEIDVVATS